jgi:hypothetical protein
MDSLKYVLLSNQDNVTEFPAGTGMYLVHVLKNDWQNYAVVVHPATACVANVNLQDPFLKVLKEDAAPDWTGLLDMIDRNVDKFMVSTNGLHDVRALIHSILKGDNIMVTKNTAAKKTTAKKTTAKKDAAPKTVAKKDAAPKTVAKKDAAPKTVAKKDAAPKSKRLAMTDKIVKGSVTAKDGTTFSNLRALVPEKGITVEKLLAQAVAKIEAPRAGTPDAAFYRGYVTSGIKNGMLALA